MLGGVFFVSLRSKIHKYKTMKSIVLPDGGVRLLLDAQGKESISFINFNKTDEGNFFLRTSNNQVSYIDKQDFLNFIFHLENLYQPTFKMVFTDKDTGVRIVNGGIEEFLKKDNCDKVHMKSEFPSTHEEAFQ